MLGDVQAPEPNPVPDRPRARLKIFFGAAPGAGKTRALLEEGLELRAQGADVVLGALDSHGQEDLEALAAGFERIPPRLRPRHGEQVPEFDLEAALARRPTLLLLDDLAHANAPGTLHPRRWQDAWDLLDAGIDVHTTLNVQEVESLRDVVARITGLHVRDVVPDTVLQRADRLELVDIAPEEIQERFRAGQIALPEAERHATERFFRTGNLLALRELALRRAADHVDAQLQRYRAAQGIQDTWAAGERLMVCVTPHPGGASLIRAAKRMAERMGAPWMAVYVETLRHLRFSEGARARVEEHLRLAERLGGETVVLQGDLRVADDLVALAHARNVTRILVGKPRGPRSWLGLGSVAHLIRRSGAIEVLVIQGDPDPGEPVPVPAMPLPRLGGRPIFALLWSAGAMALVTGLCLLLRRHLGLEDLTMLYVLGIAVVGARLGRWPALTASLLGALSLDFFILPPRYTLPELGTRHLGTFAVLIGVGLLIGNLTERMRRQTRLARVREQRTLALFRLSAELARGGSAATLAQATHSVAAQFQSRVAILLPGPSGRLEAREEDLQAGFGTEELGVAQWSFEHDEAAGLGTETLAGAAALYLPLQGSRGTIGVMGIRPEGVPRWAEPDQRHLLQVFANQTALALERSLLAERGAAVQKRVDREELRNALLSSASHDLKTPLQGIVQASAALAEDRGYLSEPRRRELAGSIHAQATRLHRLVSDLLDLTRMEAGGLTLRREPVASERLVASALDRVAELLGDREVKQELPPGLPPLSVDPLLMEQALVNLLENAARFSPVDGAVEVKAWATERAVTLAIADQGPGIPPGQELRIFEPFARIPRDHGTLGAGLGLAICKGIVEAHGGHVQASTRPMGGALFLVNLPR